MGFSKDIFFFTYSLLKSHTRYRNILNLGSRKNVMVMLTKVRVLLESTNKILDISMEICLKSGLSVPGF
jgi:hypothetical protein